MNNDIYLSPRDEEWRKKRFDLIDALGQGCFQANDIQAYHKLFYIWIEEAKKDGLLTQKEIEVYQNRFQNRLNNIEIWNQERCKDYRAAYLNPEESKILLYREEREEDPCKINWWVIAAILAFVGVFIAFMMWGG